MIVRMAFIIWMIVGAMPSRAQTVDEKMWVGVSTSIPLEQNLRLEIDTQGRFGDDSNGIYETIVSGFLTYRPNPKLSLSLGYQRNESERRQPETVENRLRQQVAGQLAQLGGGALSGRLRLEQRFRSGTDEVQIRLRPQLAYVRPFRTGSQTRWIISHESFLASRVDWNNQIGYFRMRNQAAVRFPLAKILQAEAGYLNQYEFGKRGRSDTMDHIGLFTLIFTL